MSLDLVSPLKQISSALLEEVQMEVVSVSCFDFLTKWQSFQRFHPWLHSKDSYLAELTVESSWLQQWSWKILLVLLLVHAVIATACVPSTVACLP